MKQEGFRLGTSLVTTPAGWSAIDTGYVEQKTIETMTVWQNQLIAPLGDDSGSISSSVTEIAAFDVQTGHHSTRPDQPSTSVRRFMPLTFNQGDIYCCR